MKKILIYIMCLLITLQVAFALAPCTTEASIDSSAFTGVITDGDQNITVGGEEVWSTFATITPTSNFQMNLCYNTFIANNTNNSLYWADISTILNITNASDTTQLLGAANYTTYATAGKVYWNLVSATEWNGANVSLCYNKSFTTTTDLFDLTLGYTVTPSTAYGGTTVWTINRPELTGQDWSTTYTINTRTCAATASCKATQQTIFAGFGLIAVGIIVLSAFALINLSSGNGIDLTAVAVGAIAIAIVIMVGYVIISQVGQTICQATIG